MKELIEIGYNFVTFIVELFKIKPIAIFIIISSIAGLLTIIKKKIT